MTAKQDLRSTFGEGRPRRSSRMQCAKWLHDILRMAIVNTLFLTCSCLRHSLCDPSLDSWLVGYSTSHCKTALDSWLVDYSTSHCKTALDSWLVGYSTSHYKTALDSWLVGYSTSHCKTALDSWLVGYSFGVAGPTVKLLLIVGWSVTPHPTVKLLDSWLVGYSFVVLQIPL